MKEFQSNNGLDYRILDQNTLQNKDSILLSFFNQDGVGIFCDMAFKEMVKNKVETFGNNNKHTWENSTKVLVLKSDSDILLESLFNPEKLPWNLVEFTATSNYRNFFSRLYENPSDIYTDVEFLKRVEGSKEFFNGLTRNTEEVRSLIIRRRENSSSEILRIVRNNFSLSEEIKHTICNEAWINTQKYCIENMFEFPKDEFLFDFYVFRFFLFGILFEYYWISFGGIESLKTESLKNDINDLAYLTVASYFSGILSIEDKVKIMWEKFLEIRDYLNAL